MHIKTLKERSPFILFIPFLFLYILHVVYFHTDEMMGDESRYMQFAQNLLSGFYSPAYPAIDLTNGPGYPILLMPFLSLKLPLITISLLNAVLHYLSIVYLFKSVDRLTTSFKTAFTAALCWGFYFLAYQEMACILTESLTLFLVSLFSYQICKMYSTRVIGYRSVLLAGINLGFLILTKVIFAYVLIILLLLCVIFYFMREKSTKLLKIVCILTIASVTITPYIIYTYSLTGKFFYLSSEGGKVLYWMTSLDEHEYGDWNNNNFDANCNNTLFCNAVFIAKNHGADMERIGKASSVVEVDSLFKVMAVANIKANPIKYIKNWFANIGRLLFGFPASYYFQSPTTLVRIYVNSILLLAMIYSLMFFLWNWKSTPLEVKILIVFSMTYLALSSLVSAYPRQLNIMVPVLLIWITYALKKSVKIDLKLALQN